MSTIKKLLALVLALTMVLSVSAVAAYSVVPYGDAASINEDCEMAVEMLYNLGIMKGDNKGNFNPEATITRAEVAKMIYVVLNYGEDDLAKNYTGAKIFSDVEAGLWYEGYINYAATTKLVQGRPDGTFGPNDPITCAEAAKMLLTAIGYSAEARGYTGAGWDKQVLADAAIIGLLDGYDYNTNTYAPRQWVAVMFVNALLDAYTYGTIAPVTFNGLLTGINYDKDYQTMGKKYFGLYKWSGVIDVNEYGNLTDADKDETLSAGQTNVGKHEFKGWTTDLTEIGEYRWGYACEKSGRDTVVYVGGHEDNTVFSTGMEVTDITSKSKIGGIRINEDTKFYKNFDEVDYKEFTSTTNGDWLRVVHNDSDSTYAEYVFLTTFEMTEITKVSKDDTVTLAAKDADKKAIASDEFVIYEDAAAGDIVLYTKIEDKEYVELAESFTGEVDKYTYKTETLTVDEKDYPQSYIKVSSIENDYYTVLEDAAKKTEYTYYLDFFGNIRIFGEDVADSGDLALLTDAYYETNRSGSIAAVDAYLDGEIKDTDVRNSATYTDIEEFINTRTNSSNGWNRLIEYKEDATAWTNVARYTMSDEGVMSLYTAQTWKYDKKGNEDYVKTDYIDLDEVDVDAGETTYTGKYYTYKTIENADKTTSVVIDKTYDVKVQANRNTVFYYVDEDLNIKSVVGYKNSLDVINEIADINAIYAVGTNVSKEYVNTDDAAETENKYWVADVIVVETKYPVFNLDSNVVLGFNAVNKTVNDYAALDVIGADGAEDVLNVISLNGDSYNKYEAFNDAADIEIPAFYWNTEDEDGESYIIEIEDNYAKYGIYAETLNRVNKLDEYVVMADGDVLYYDEETVVYDMYAGKRYVAVTTEDDYEDALELTTGSDYILYVDSDDVIVYAVLVEDSYNADKTLKAYDVARELWNEIVADAQPDPYETTYEYAVKVATDALAKAAAVADGDVEAMRVLVNGDLKVAYALLAPFRNTGDAEKDAAVANLYVALAKYSEAFKAEIAEFDADLKAAQEAAKATIDTYANNILSYYNAQQGTAVVVTEETIAAVVAAQKAEVEKLTTLEAVAEYVEFDNEAPAYAALDAAIEAACKAAKEAADKKAEDDAAAKVNDDFVVAVMDADIVTSLKDGATITVTEKAAAIEAALVEAGYTDVEVVIKDGKIDSASGKDAGVTINFRINASGAAIASAADTAALADALADADVETIVLGSGEYELTSVMNKDVTIIGNGETIVAGCPYDGELYNQVYGNSGSLTVKNVIFNSPAPTGSWNMAARLSGSIDATFEGCTFIGMSTAIYQSGADTVITIKDCTFETTGCAIQSEAYSGDFTLGQDLIIENCDFTGLADVLHIYDHDKDPSSEAIAAYLTANGNTFTGTCKQTAK